MWCSTTNFFSSLKTKFGSVPSWMRERRILHLWSRLSTTWAKSWCFLTCLNRDNFGSFRFHTTHLTLLLNMVPYDTFNSFAGFCVNFLGFLLIFSLVEFTNYVSSTSSRTTLPWPLLNISSLRFKVLQTNILLTFRLLQISCLEFPALNSSTIAVRLSKTLLRNIFCFLKA